MSEEEYEVYGCTRNPLRFLNADKECICMSGNSIRECCGKSEFVDLEWAEEIEEKLRDLGLIE